MQLVIVESPTKANTIKKFLGQKYEVLSSYGHIRDLPKSELGIDTEKDFQPKYIIPIKARKNLKLLMSTAKKSDDVILATDEDREGEAIAWHLSEALKLNDYKRIVFHEITKPAIEEALKNPRKIDMDLVDAQQARRILDRLVGYKLSPFLWKKIARGLSAGRVQSVAVRLVVEREKEIQAFKPQEYWKISVILKKEKDDKEFEANLAKVGGSPLDKLEIKNEKEAKKILENLEGAEYKVENVEKKEVKKNPFPPFTTSTLQQDGFRKLGFPAKFTMQTAQKLYEKGHITYHRTDSLNLSDVSLFAAKKFITENYGENYWAGYLRKYKTKSKNAQEAHEAIRPTFPENSPEKLKKKEDLDEAQFKLYNLIWRRFIACQMTQAVFDATAADVLANDCSFRANGQILKFDGFLKVYSVKFTEADLPILQKNEVLELIKLEKSQHFTEPPARYNEASLIKVLEENGIGRPSTYAPILSTIQERNYITKDESRRFIPTEIGTVVNNLLVEHFQEIVDMKFTAKMEEELDQIAREEKKWIPVIKDFYSPFAKHLEGKYGEVSKKEFTEKPTDRTCPKCSSPLIIRLGRFGKFYACSGFPKCRFTESLQENKLDVNCPECGGEVVVKRTKKGKIFYGCKNWPKCTFAAWDKPTGKKCEKCGKPLVETKKGKIKCSNKDCK